MNSLHLAGVIVLTCFSHSLFAQQTDVNSHVVFAEQEGLLTVEAEDFYRQTRTEKRAFYLTSEETTPNVTPDGDLTHLQDASGQTYLEILPDTRRTHGDRLIKGENFSPEPGKLATLYYRVHIENPGKYYVWVRAYSTGSEDNGLHVGINGSWPESGQRLQWCQGKNSWRWESKQRTAQNHCGEPHKIYLQIDRPGEHTIHFSMREDGFEFDKWLITTNRDFVRPADAGPETSPPLENATTASNEQSRIDYPTLQMPASSFTVDSEKGYYLDNEKWLAVDPSKNQSGSISQSFRYPTGHYNVTLQTIGENDGQSQYQLFVDDTLVGSYTAPLSDQTFEIGTKYQYTWNNIKIDEGATIRVVSSVASLDDKEFSRARWAGLLFSGADSATQKTVAELAN